MSRMATTTAPFGSTTVTLTLEEPSPSTSASASQPTEAVVLRLKHRQKKVTWKEGTVDNEFLNRKSSKKCCIFHKEKPFDEDDSDEEDCGKGTGDDGAAGPNGCCSRGNGKEHRLH